MIILWESVTSHHAAFMAYFIEMEYKFTNFYNCCLGTKDFRGSPFASKRQWSTTV